MPDVLFKTLLDHVKCLAGLELDVPILQSADPFLETAGENLRRSIFMTQTANGSTKCLRPEFTIPICLAHDKGIARYSYGGTVFRQSRKGSTEFEQIGLEDLGDTDRMQADAACIADMLDALETVNLTNPNVVIGDQNLFGVVVDNLKLPEAVSARLVRSFGDAARIDRVLQDLTASAETTSATGDAQMIARTGNHAALVAHIEDRMQAGNMSPKSGRSAEDIARRMISKVSDASFRLDDAHAQILRNFLALELPLDDAAKTLEGFAKTSDIEFGAALGEFKQRVDALKERGISIANFTYRASFGRKLDYYTGLLFDMEFGGVSFGGGGRYDSLCTLLGHDTPVPAVGFSIALDRVSQALKGAV